ncbi:MAG: hypothetical protein VZS44_03755 [Bacilli bacterium]|nr:hypothetical protein [Bacilli bacterium]
MFKKLLNKIENKTKKETVPQEIKNDENNKIILTRNGDVFKMSILGHPTLHIFFEKVRELPQEDQDIILKLPLSILANSNQEVHAGNYIWITIDNSRYIIMSNRDTININQTKKLNDHIEERSVSLNKMTNEFTIYRAIHDKNNSTLEHKGFNTGDYGSIPSVFELSPKEAKEEFELLFNNLIHEEKICAELEGVIEIEKIKFIIDTRFNYVIANSQHRR